MLKFVKRVRRFGKKVYSGILYSMYLCKESRVKVSLNNIGNLKNNKSVVFEGYRPSKDEKGYKIYEFNYPFDSNNYDCYLELYEVNTDEFGNYIIGRKLNYINPDDSNADKKIENGKPTIVNLAADYGVTDMQKPIAYHYKGVPKAGGGDVFKVDNGIIIDERNNQGKHVYDIFNVIPPNETNNFRGGAAKLFITDTYKPGYYYDKNGNIKENSELKNRAKNAIPNFTTIMGGNFAGVEKGLEEGDFDSYDYLITPPWFMASTLGGHGYWNENNYQISPNIGNISEYARLQKKLFAKDKHLVTDGAFVNEGLNGIHFQHMLKWEEDSYAYGWMDAKNIKSNPLSLGTFGKNHEFISHKIINSPYAYRQTYSGFIETSENLNYDSRKPTYVQIFDKRRVAENEKKDATKLIKNYEKNQTDNELEINNHNDTVMAYYFKVNPEFYNNNIKSLNEYNRYLGQDERIDMDSYLGTRILTKLGNFNLDEKFEGGYAAWEANPDILKLNFVASNAATQESFNIDSEKERADFFRNIEAKNNEVQDYIISSARYWTRKTNQILNLNAAQHLKAIDIANPNDAYNKILENIDNGVFPQSLKREINKQMVENVLNGEYNLKPLSTDNFMTQLENNLMDVPLESIELGNDIVGVFASPYLSKRATTADFIGKTRSETYREGDTTIPQEHKELYDKSTKLYLQNGAINEFATKILTGVNQKLGKKRSLLNEYRDATPYGKYAMPYLANEIVRFAIIKGLFPRADVKVNEETGEIIYDYEELKKTSLKDLRINDGGAKEEATHLINKIQSGVKNIKESDRALLISALIKMLEGTNENSFKLAEMIVDRSGIGLDYRIDATKDIADIEALKDTMPNNEAMKDSNTDFEYTWDKINDFWKKFAQLGVFSENPNAKLWSEMTDETALYENYAGRLSQRYSNPNVVYPGARDNQSNMEAIDMKFLRETGITSLANYTYIFSTLSDMFGLNTEDGQSKMGTDTKTVGRKIYDKFVQPGMYNNYLKAMPLSALITSYNFIGNHDKPRILHCLAMDMGLFYTNLSDPKNHDYRVRAYRVIEDEHDPAHNVDKFVSEYDFSRVNPKAIAAAEMLRFGLIDGLNALAGDNNASDAFKGENHKRIYEAIGKSLKDLAKGNYLNKTFETDGLGVNEIHQLIDIVLKQAEAEHKLKLSKADRKVFADKAFEIIIKPAYSKLDGMQKYLAAMVGMPTLYAGDELGSTGYETKTKNIYLRNRGYLHYEWADPNNKTEKKQFIIDGKKQIDKEMGIRAKFENHALNDGAPIMLKLQYPKGDESSKNCPITAFFRQSTDGAMAISLLNPTGMTKDPKVMYKPAHLELDSIGLGKDLGEYNEDVGLNFGIQPGTKFVDARYPENEYVVREFQGNYFIKKVNKAAPEDPNQDLPVTIYDSTLVLTHAPSFTGRINRAMVPNRYEQPKENKVGSKLELIAR